MSAYTKDRSHLISFAGAGAGAGPAPGAQPQPQSSAPPGMEELSKWALSGVFDKLESFFETTRRLETALAQEKAKTSQLQEQFRENSANYDRLIREAQAKGRELETREHRYRAALAEYREYERRVKHYVETTNQELAGARAELRRYRSAWSEVLEREREAKQLLAESDRLRQANNELDSRNRALAEEIRLEKTTREQSERHSKSYQAELQNALLRLHSAESRLSELTKEVELQDRTKRNFDDEVAKLEKAMWERFQWMLIKEKERLRSELEKESALEREKFREMIRKEARSESERTIQHAETEIARLRTELAQAREELDRRRVRDESQVLRDETVRELQVRIEAADRKISSLEAAIAEERRSAGSAKLSVEQERERADRLERALSEEKTKLEAALAKPSLDPLSQLMAGIESDISAMQEALLSCRDDADGRRASDHLSLLLCEKERLGIFISRLENPPSQ